MSTVDEFIEEKLEEIDAQIQRIDNHKVMRAAQRLIEQKNRLQTARRALLGVGNRTTGNAGGRVTQDEVVAWFKQHPPGETFEVNDVAEAMGHSPEVVRGHLNRGKGERFIKTGRNQWALRDPEAGINTEDDLEDDE